MAFFNFEREQTNIKVKGQAVTVPNNCFAKLMYYLDSVSSCVPGLDIPSEYKNYDSYNNLNDDDKRTIIALAALMSPDLLEGKVFFLVDDNHRLLLGSRNKFYELTIAKQYLGGLVAGQGVICVNGQKKQATDFMIYERSWLVNYFINPLSEAMQNMREAQAARRRQEKSQSCTLL